MLDFLGGLFGTATSPDRLLEQPLRRRLLELIGQRRGIHASELCREAGQPWGTVQYHLGLLHRGDMVTSIETGRERHFFPAKVEPRRARLLALMHQGRRAEIADYIRAHPGSRQVDICGAVNVSRKTFRASVEPLVAEGLVHERRGLQFNRYFPQGDLEAVLADATSVGPAAPVALVDEPATPSSPEFV